MENIKKILDLLSPSEQRRLYILLLLILIMAFIEMLGVASILPFMAVLANPELVDVIFIKNIFLRNQNFELIIKNFYFSRSISFYFFNYFSISKSTNNLCTITIYINSRI